MMKISLITTRIKLNILYKYVKLNELLNFNNISLEIFLVNVYNHKAINDFIKTYEKNYIYKEYISNIKKLKINLLDLKNKEHSSNLKNCDSIIWSTDFTQSKVRTSQFNKTHILLDDELIFNKTTFIKLRGCNDIGCQIKFPNESKFIPKSFYLPSPIYLHNEMLIDSWKVKYSESQNEDFDKIIKFCFPFETPNTDNTYINLNKEYLTKKYQLNTQLPNMLIYEPSSERYISKIEWTEYFIFQKFIKMPKIKKRYNILVCQNPYHDSKLLKNKFHSYDISNVSYIHEIDHSYLIRNKMISIIAGGMSTTFREALVNNIPVINFSPYKCGSKKIDSSWLEEFTLKSFSNLIKYEDQFEGINAKPDESGNYYIELLEKIEYLKKKYNFNHKRKIWFSDIQLENIITKAL